MFRISVVEIGHRKDGCVTDERPNIRFALESDHQGDCLDHAEISCGDWSIWTADQLNNVYGGEFLPETKYTIKIRAVGKSGEEAFAEAEFETGKLDSPWEGKWITDETYSFPEGESPRPMVFFRSFEIEKPLCRAWIHSTALGIYEMELNGRKVGEDYFAPGFTSYAHNIQYQTYDILALLEKENNLSVTVAGGWAAGAFTMKRKSHISCERQAFLGEIHLEYEDGTSCIIGTDESWKVTEESPYRLAEWYDGEDYDATFTRNADAWKPACRTKPQGSPRLLAAYGEPVRLGREIMPLNHFPAKSGEVIYDFGENFAGIISFQVKSAEKGAQIVFRHAEVLVDGELFVKPLRTAKASIVYRCKEGEQNYMPHFTYMGFRYVGVSGVQPENLELKAYALHSRLESVGKFACSNQLLNRLHENIRRSGLSNFVDIPTDCPQRDERMGWTGDAAVFASTACYHFDMSRFYDKWLRDQSAEQSSGGGFPMVIPRQGDTWPVMATSCWGDSCILVPWAEYLARGDRALLERQYPAMRKFLKAAKWWAGFLAFGSDKRYIWSLPFHFGDWCAPGGDFMQWISKAKWVGTAYFANSCRLMARIATILDQPEDAKKYEKMERRIRKAYRKVLTDGNGKLKQEFQTAYVLPLHFNMTEGTETENMADNLVQLLEREHYAVGTGFPGTPYLLFALSDHGHLKEAYRLLMEQEQPGWLYAVKNGATSIWERWDAMRPDGTVNLGEHGEHDGGMVSFNHYANGAVGDWLYRRMVGIEAVEGGYKAFRIAPMPGGSVTWASGSIETPYGIVAAEWNIQGESFEVKVQVPVSAACELILPDGQKYQLQSGCYAYRCILRQSSCGG